MLIGPFEGLSQPAHSILSSTLWIAIWWITEAIPIAATALIPIVLLHSFRWVRFISYNSILWTQMVFLYLGGFLIAIGIEKWNLQKDCTNIFPLLELMHEEDTWIYDSNCIFINVDFKYGYFSHDASNRNSYY